MSAPSCAIRASPLSSAEGPDGSVTVRVYAAHVRVWYAYWAAVAVGVNLVVYRRSHEEVCRIEVEQHRSLRMVAGNGYSANAFALTGLALIALAVVILVLQLFR